MIYYYAFDYDDKYDEFYGRVETAKGNYILFELDEERIKSLIKEKVMCHIDDVSGLKEFLILKKIIEPDDSLLIDFYRSPYE